MTADNPKAGARTAPATAYVFWHPPKGGQPVHDYEEALRAFHRSLVAVPSEGLHGSRVARISEYPWLPEGGYEDWYFVRRLADLETLNSAAVDTTRSAAHDDIAARAGQGAGAIYGLAIGTATPSPAWVTWLSKPRGVAYEDFYENLLSLIERTNSSLSKSIGIWRRQLVLGPAPEFCMTSAEPIQGLLTDWGAIAGAVDQVYAS